MSVGYQFIHYQGRKPQEKFYSFSFSSMHTRMPFRCMLFLSRMFFNLLSMYKTRSRTCHMITVARWTRNRNQQSACISRDTPSVFHYLYPCRAIVPYTHNLEWRNLGYYICITISSTCSLFFWKERVFIACQ